MTEQDEKSTETPEAPKEEAPTVRQALDAAWEAAVNEETPSEASKEEETKPEEAPAEAVETPEEVTAPDWWDGDAEVWTGLQPEVRDVLVKRETARQEAIESERLSPELRAQLSQIEEYAKSAYGMTADQALERLYQAQRMLDTNSSFGILQLAKQYGVDLSQLAELGDSPQAQPQQDANPLAVVQNVVRQELAQFEKRQLDQQTATAMTELEAWAGEKDAEGRLLRPHFEDLQHLVKAEMDSLITANPKRDRWSTLQQAYDNVAKVKAAPNVEALAEKRAQEKLAELQAQAKKAEKAAVSPPSTASGTARETGEPPKTVREALNKAWDSLESGTATRI